MKVILNSDVGGLGEEGDIRDVANGYARNYLIPKKFALAYTKHNLTQFESRRTAIDQRKEEKRKEAMGIKERLESEELTFTMPAGDSGKLFGSVNNAMVVQELENRGYTIERKRVEVPENNIRMLGNYTVKVKLYGNEEAQINILVEAAEEK